MKIDSSTPLPAAPPKARQQIAAGSAATNTATSHVSAATHLEQADALGSATPPFDSQRVAEIRQAIVDGRFHIDASKIADQLIDGVRDLLKKEPPLG